MRSLISFMAAVLIVVPATAQQQQPPQQKPIGEKSGLIPLAELGTRQKYKGEDGGLYGGGKNEPPKGHLDAALAEAKKIEPLDADGKPAKDGRIVLLSIGMSNTTQEFSQFVKLAPKSAKLVVVDGAQGGKDAAAWNSPDAQPWGEVERRLQGSKVWVKQVQAVWIKQALAGPGRIGDFPKHSAKLQEDLGKIVRIAKSKYPNLRIAYLSSRIYAGYAKSPLNPEPYSYESAFSVRGLILDQIKGDKELNYDGQKGEVKAPLLLWGPYLWADGTTPRKSDKLVWENKDFGGDGTHPSNSGQQKVAQLLLTFFKTDPTSKPWFD